MGEELESILTQFRAAALNYIYVVDSAIHSSREGLLSKISNALAQLYSSGLLLPAIEPDTSEIDDIPFPRGEWSQVFNALKEKIGSLDTYWTVFDSTQGGVPVQGSLAGDISEIYIDLKHDLQLEEKGLSRSDFLWQLRFSFRSHWGRHLTHALTAIYDRQVE